ncbi:MAG: SDR family NAD(P)-dependent oxidoreductase [Oscillospiraceae bacterium]|nr:SDR family NAD(P)-dependent oxidoreductase [Oscillospiraceae bacterium]
MNRLVGKVAIITGANSGIGKRTAELFAEEGADLVLVARRMDKLKEVEHYCRSIGCDVLSVSADVSVQADCQRVCQTAADTFGRIDILVNNAGIADKHRPITRCDADWWEHIIQVDQSSVFYMMQQAIKYMAPARSGSIVNISSIGGTSYNSGIAYTAAKTAVIGMSKNVALQFAGQGIRVNVIAPGPTPTPLNTPDQVATFDLEFAGQCARHFDDTVPEATADDQAKAILFFASDDSSGCNGQVVVVDNGRTI